MNDFAARLEEICTVLESLDYRPPEEFSAMTVQVGRRTALAMMQEVRAHVRSGVSELEATAALPFTLAFLTNAFVYCTELRGDAGVVDRIMQAAAKIAHGLGDGDMKHAPANRDSPSNCH